MRRVLSVITVIGLVGLGIWLGFFRTSPTVRSARIYARQFREKIQSDNRFTNVEVVVFELGDKSPLGIRGTVKSDSDSADLHRTFDSLHCPVSTSWYVTVVTNQPKL
jgi:hypothetical protein